MAVIVYDNGNSSGLASDDLSWVGDTKPGASDIAKLDGTSTDDCAIDENTSWGGVDIQAAYTGTLTQNATRTLTIGASDFIQAGGTFTGGDSTIDINGDFTMSGGTFTSTTGTLFWGGDVDTTSGTFTHNSGLVRLNGPTKAINTGSQIFNNITVFIDAGANNLNITGTIDCDGNFILLQVGRIDGIISIAGDITLNDAIVGGDGRLLIDGTGTQTMQVDGAGGSAAVPSIELDKPSGDLIINDNLTMSFDSFGFVVTNGTFTHNGTFTFGSSTSTLDIGSNTFNNFVAAGSAPFINTIVGTVKVTGSFSTGISNIIYNGGTFELTGASITGNAGSFAGTTVMLISGTGAQTLNAGNYPAGTFTINKPSGTLTLGGNQTFSISGQDVTFTNGTLDLAGFDFTVDDVFTMASGTRLKVKGDENVTIGTPSIDDASTVEFYDSAVTAVIDNILTSYGNLELGDKKTHNVTDTATITINGIFSTNATSTITRSKLRSTTPSTQWSLILNGTSTLADLVDVRDSDASGGLLVNAVGSIGQNNDNWNLGDSGSGGLLVTQVI